MSLYKGTQLISGAMPNSANQSLSNLDSAGQDKFDEKVNTSLSNLSATGQKVIDGQWINANDFSIYSGAQNIGFYTIDLSNALPNDGYIYECIFTGDGYTLATSGARGDIRMRSTLSTIVFLAKTQTRTASEVQFGGTVTLIVGTDRVAQYQVVGNNVGNLRIFLVSYRRIGTNA
jgi:hypothetical protein